MCLTLPMWLKALDKNFVCILVYRHPVEVAIRLSRFRTRPPLSFVDWLSLWENYTVGSLTGCLGMTKIIVTQKQLGEQPLEATTRLFRDLMQLAGVPNLTLPTQQEVLDFLALPGEGQNHQARDGPKKEGETNQTVKTEYEKVEIRAEHLKQMSIVQHCLVYLFEMGKAFEWDPNLASTIIAQNCSHLINTNSDKS